MVAGWICVALLPFLGFFLGVDAYQKGRRVEGRQIMVASAALTVLWVVVALALRTAA